MIIEPAHRADVKVWEPFFPYFGERLPHHLGSVAFKTTRKRLGAEGYPDVKHTEEVFDRSLTNGLGYLDGHGGESVRNPSSWFHAICRHETTRYLIDADAHDSAALSSLMDGDTDLFDVRIFDPQRVDELLRQAIDRIPPRHQELIRLDMVERLPSDSSPCGGL